MQKPTDTKKKKHSLDALPISDKHDTRGNTLTVTERLDRIETEMAALAERLAAVLEQLLELTLDAPQRGPMLD